VKKLQLALVAVSLIFFLAGAQSPAQQRSGKIYWMSTTTVPLGKMQEFHTFVEKELMPLQEKAGYHYVAGWQTIVGDIEEVSLIAEFDDMDAYQKARTTLFASPEWKAVTSHLEGFSRAVRTRMMVALPYIKMK
jgi:hypothetical protein